MVNVLKIVRYSVKTIAVLISLCFVFNSVNGVLSAVKQAKDGINPAMPDPGDYKIKYDDLQIEAGINITNEGIYTMDGIIIGMIFQMRANETADWQTILNQTSVSLGDAPVGGDKIFPGESKFISLNATLPDFALNPSEIATLFGLGPTWDLMDLLTIDFDAQLVLDFSIGFAYRQYVLNIEIILGNTIIETGLGGA